MNSQFDLDIAPEKKKILITDDDPIVASMLEAALADDFEVAIADSGEACLATVASYKPDLVLLDIEMPGMDGYTTCQALQEQSAVHFVPVIFVSSHDSLEERLRAYEVGGVDFIIKPFEPEELLQKAQIAIELKAEREQLAQEKDSMQKMAMSFLTNLGESGVVLKFLRNCFTCNDYPSLVKMAIEAMAEYGLEALVQIRTPNGTYTYTPSGQASELETSVFAKTHSLDRIFQFKSRMIINYPHASLLVNNMPIDDADLCGRIRDNAAYITEGVEASATAIMLREDVVRHVEQQKRVAQQTVAAIENLREQYRKQQSDTRYILHSLTENMEKLYVYLGLTEGQEKAVADTVSASIEQALKLFEQGLDFDGQFAAVLEGLKKVS
ncbi:response regulator receiver domain-containing protein [Sulfuritortus calidifontis]|uniref:Response regulator receiver domain-containing protein n=1 Tax=Sulfuritortus calidifontis TaxID=1914471 RepID=A0A4R3JXJ3_9PROT|nr:response regulator [Sulfuritortus calidifontis]TCS73055.1 response regulator receiver domain-containing protein [Sulfuritortus calidifontis]